MIAYFITSELNPFFAMEFLVKLQQYIGADKIDKTITDVTIILSLKKVYFYIARQVKEVIRVLEIMIDLIRQVLNCVFIRYIFYHESSSWVITYIQRIYIKYSIIVILHLLGSEDIL